jgi:hypothetical protein
VKADPQTNFVTESRILCAYPLTTVYDGVANPNVYTSYRCSSNGLASAASRRAQRKGRDPRR